MCTTNDVLKSARKFASSVKDEGISIIVDSLCDIIKEEQEKNAQLKRAIKLFEDVKCNMPSWWWDKNMYSEGSDEPESLDDVFKQLLKGSVEKSTDNVCEEN